MLMLVVEVVICPTCMWPPPVAWASSQRASLIVAQCFKVSDPRMKVAEASQAFLTCVANLWGCVTHFCYMLLVTRESLRLAQMYSEESRLHLLMRVWGAYTHVYKSSQHPLRIINVSFGMQWQWGCTELMILTSFCLSWARQCPCLALTFLNP